MMTIKFSLKCLEFIYRELICTDIFRMRDLKS